MNTDEHGWNGTVGDAGRDVVIDEQVVRGAGPSMPLPPPMSASPRTKVRRHPERGVYDRETIHRIIDEALICHAGIVDETGQPFVMPTIHTRIGEALYLHGSHGSRLLKAIASGAPVCITMTIVDGIVLARSAMHHSMNYRCAVVLGPGREVTDREHKARVFEALMEHVMPGRSRDCRMPSERESEATMVVEVMIDEASAKVRTGGVIDDEADLSLPQLGGRAAADARAWRAATR